MKNDQQSPPKKIHKMPTMSTKKFKKKKAQNFNEESLREILGFFVNQVDIKKFLKKVPKGQDNDDRIQDDFLNPNEFGEIKGAYDDYNIGDLVMVFQNPDHESVANKAVTFKEAENVIDNILTVMDEGVSKSQMKRERDSFLYSFLTLDDFVPKKKEDKNKAKDKDNKDNNDNNDNKDKDNIKVNKKDNIKDNKDNDKSQQQQKISQQDTFLIKQSQGDLKKKQVSEIQIESGKKQQDENNTLISKDIEVQIKEELNSYQKYLEFSKQLKLTEDQKRKDQVRKLECEDLVKDMDKQIQKKQMQIKKQQNEIDLADDQYEEEQNQRKLQLEQLQNEEQELIEKQQKIILEIEEIENKQQSAAKIIVDPVKELLKIDLENPSQFKQIKKQWSQGHFLEMKMVDETDYDWICLNNTPRDFLTLVRFVVMNKLCRNGFLHCRQFVSMTGLHIFLVIKSNKAVITRQAQNMKLTKQIELGYADLFSLEPVDKNFRPLRIKNYIRSYASDDKIKNRLTELHEGRGQGGVNNIRPGERVEDHCRGIYPTVCQWDDFELRVQSIKKQTQVDKYMKIIAKELKIDQSHEKVELMDDIEISRAEWEAYFIYNEYLVCFGETILQLQENKYPEIKENLAFLYKLIFRKALGDANEFWFDRNYSFWREISQQKQIIKSIWGRLNIDPVAPYANYFIPIDESGQAMWRKYEVNEKGMRSEFINMEKIKITHAIVLRNINVLRLIKEQMAFAYFPIHDQYQLKGASKDPFFTHLSENGLMYKKIDSVGLEEVKKLFNELKDEAESTDFDSDSLELETMFNYKVPWGMPVATMRDYFGEKLALYFNFLSYYSKQLWYMAVIGIITQAMMAGSNKELRSAAIMLFSICIIVWSTFFIEFWKREQVIFSVQFGQQNFEQAEAERPAFIGTQIRSITNDELNEAFYSPFKRKMKQLFSLSISLLIIGCVIGCVLGLFMFKNQLIEQQQPPFISQQVPAILNSVQIGFFNFIYQTLVNIFNIFENHKILSSYEDALISKVFIFRFVNNFNSFLIIAFLESYFKNLNLCSINGITNCFGILENQMSVIFIASVTKYISAVITPFVKAFIESKMRKVDEKPIIHPFNQIDTFIESQLSLAPYQTNDELDGTVNSYMELTIQFSYLCLFGIAFPSAYLLAFFSNAVGLQVDKLQLVRFQRRPFPQGAATIGNWLIILEIITFFGIFTNAGLIVYTSESIKENHLMVFAGLLIIFLIMKYCIRFLVPDEPESALILNKRHQYIVDKVVKGFGQSDDKAKANFRFNHKIGGVVYSSKNNNKFSQKID